MPGEGAGHVGPPLAGPQADLGVCLSNAHEAACQCWPGENGEQLRGLVEASGALARAVEGDRDGDVEGVRFAEGAHAGRHQTGERGYATVLQPVDQFPGRAFHVVGAGEPVEGLAGEAARAIQATVPSGRAVWAPGARRRWRQRGVAGVAEECAERSATHAPRWVEQVEGEAAEGCEGHWGVFEAAEGMRASPPICGRGPTLPVAALTDTIEGMEVTVLLFASLAEKAGWRKRAYELREGDTVASVRDRLVAEHPQLAMAVPSLLYAINEDYVREYDPVPAGATLALIPPVSGGADDADTCDG